MCIRVTPPEACSAGRTSRSLIGRRASGGGSVRHTDCVRVIGAVDMSPGGVWIAYIKQALGAGQLVVAAPVTGSLVCFIFGGTDWVLQDGYQVLLQLIAEYCNMDAVVSLEVDNRTGKTFEVELYVPWDAPGAVVDVSSAGMVPLRELPDVMGLVGRRDNATESLCPAGSLYLAGYRLP